MRIWVGKRESDIQTYNYFDYSITFWGSNDNGNRAFCTANRIHSSYSKEFTMFVIDELKKLIELSSRQCEIHFYNNTFAYKIISIDNSFNTYIKNINNSYIHDLIRHKTLSRLWLSNVVDVPSFTSISKHECTTDNLMRMFPNYSSFVIQENFSGGGDGTFFLNANTINKILPELSDYKIYLASPYYDNNTSVSCSILIDRNSCCTCPVAKQLLNLDSKIKYYGNSYFNNDSTISFKVKKMAQQIGNSLRSIGYRGICGLDFILTGNDIFLIEVNPRYQGSSFAINEELRRQNLPSLFELNTLCFEEFISSEIKYSIQNLNIDFENRCVFNNSSKIIEGEILKKFNDGYLNSKSFENDVYLYRYFSK